MGYLGYVYVERSPLRSGRMFVGASVWKKGVKDCLVR